MMRMENAPNLNRRNGLHRELALAEEAPAETRAAERRSVRTTMRLYCVMCGRSETVQRAPAQPGRCSSCGGTLLTEFDSA
jgi:ribosomal protein S27E